MTDDRSEAKRDGTPRRTRAWGLFHTATRLVVSLAVLMTGAAATAGELPGYVRSWSTAPCRPYDVAVLSTGVPWLTCSDAVATIDVATGTATSYPLTGVDPAPAFNTLAVDAADRLWIADSSDRLVRFDPATGMFTVIPLPGDVFTLPALPFGVSVAPDGTIWFTCWEDPSLGRYDPVSGGFTRFAPVGGLPSDPVEIAFDAAGIGYFTMRTSGGNPPGLGRIDSSTGAFQTWLDPYPGAFNPWGIVRVGSVFWFMDHSASLIVRFDPATAMFTPWSTAPELIDGHYLVADDVGRLWFSAFGNNRLGRFDPATAVFDWKDIGQETPHPIGIARAADGSIWLADTGGPLGETGFLGGTRYRDPGPTPVPVLGRRGLGILVGVVVCIGVVALWRGRRLYGAAGVLRS